MRTLTESNRNTGRNLVLEQLEERIVLDGAAEAKSVDMMDGEWHELDDGTWYIYHADGNHGEWWLDENTGIGYEYGTGNWGLRDESGWDTLHSSTADSTAFYDGQWIDLYNGQWFRLEADRYAYFWSQKAGYEAYFCFDYDAVQWWQDTNGYYVSGGWTTFDDPSTATDFDDFIYDGVWYQLTNHQWFMLQDGMYGYWWSDYGGTESYFCYDYDAEQWWRDDDGDYLTVGPWSMFPNAGFGSQFVYDGDEYARSANAVYWLEDSQYGYWEHDKGTDVQLFCYDNETGQWWQDIDGLRGTEDWVTYGDPGASPTPPFDYPNDPPENSLPDTQFMVEDTTLIFSASNGNAITVSDPDVGADTLQVELTVDDGTLSLGGTDGVTFVAGADGTSSMTFEGSTEDINSALDGLAFSPTADFNRRTALHITTSDLGNVGTGGAQSDTDGLLIYVQPVNDGPPTTSGIADVTVEDGAPDTVFSLWPLFTDDDDPSYTLSYSVTGNTNPGLFTSVDISDPTNFTLAYAPHAYGTSDITIRVADTDGLWVETTFTVTVNDTPTTSGIADVTVDEDAADTVFSLYPFFADIEDADSALTYTVVDITYADLFEYVDITDPTNFTLAHAPNAHGTSDITIRATDTDGLWVEDTFTVTVNSVNDTPTTSGIADVTVDEDAADTVFSLYPSFADIEDADSALTYTVVDITYADLFDSVDITDPSNFTLAYAHNTYGTSDITIRATDTDGLRVDTTFTVTVNQVLGDFTDSGQLLGSNSTESVALGDVDGDGDLDLVKGNFDQGNRIWLNDGSGSFTDSGQSLGAYATGSVALGDVDGDGDLDLVEGNFMENSRVWLNDGSGGFTDSGQLLGAYSTSSVALGDVDGDGDLDIVAGIMVDRNRVWLNDGSGSFTDSGQLLGGNVTSSVALGDVDGDDDLDIVAGNTTGEGNRHYINNGSGSFTHSGQSLGSYETQSVALGDVDGDGDLDIVAGNSDGQGNRIWLNDGSGSFTDSGQSLGSNSTESVALGDVDGDGDLDIVAGNNSGQGNRIWLNDGAGSFTNSGQSLGSYETHSVALGDVDGDGDLDLVAGNYYQGNRIYLND